MSSAPPDVESGQGPGQTGGSGLRWNAWNFLLLLPLVMLLNPIFNFDHPRFLGFPFFYWFQFLCVLLGVGSVWTVYVKTKDSPSDLAATRKPVDELTPPSTDLGEGDGR